MRINSDFRDVYDIYQSYDKSDPIVYNRQETFIPGQLYLYKKGNGKFIPNPDMPDDLKIFSISNPWIREDNWSLEGINIFSFCGKPFIRLKQHIHDLSYKNDRYEYIFPTVDEFQNKYGKVRDFPITAMNFIRNGNYERLLDAHKKYKSPIIKFDLNSGAVIINPILGKNFKIKSFGEIYQEIESFIGNELTEQMKNAKMTDREKVVSHGFDLKSSFRH